MLLTIFKYLFMFHEILMFLKYANQPSDDVTQQIGSDMMKRDISANVSQKYLILHALRFY